MKSFKKMSNNKNIELLIEKLKTMNTNTLKENKCVNEINNKISIRKRKITVIFRR